MVDRVGRRFDLRPRRLAGDAAYGAVKLLKWLVDRGIMPHVPVWDIDRPVLTAPLAEPTFCSTGSVMSTSAQTRTRPGGPLSMLSTGEFIRQRGAHAQHSNSAAPKILEPAGRQFRVARRMHDI